MSKYLKYFSILLLSLSLVLGIVFYFNLDSEAMVETLLYYTYALFGFAVLLLIVLPIIGMINNPKTIKKMAINLGAVVVVFGLGYILASGDPLPTATTVVASENVLKLTDAGLIVSYILVACSILAIISGGIMNLVRNR